MTRGRWLSLIGGVLLVALIAWIASNTYWADVQVPMPLKGEALRNPFYAAQRFAEALGARTFSDRALTPPASNAVLVLSDWHWDFGKGRRETLERWVESGGRLVVDGSFYGGEAFESWSGIVRNYREFDEDLDDDELPEQCRMYSEELNGVPTSVLGTHVWMCDVSEFSSLTSKRDVAWALRESDGIQAMRVKVGRGSVTFINASPFRERGLFNGDHGFLFVAATQLRRGDEVHFLTEADHLSLVALIWLHGSPIVTLALMLTALWLWRASVRFGPLVASPDPARRSLGEQIRGTGRFALRHGGGEALHAASLRALDEAAAQRIHGYLRLPPEARADALARITKFDPKALAAALLSDGGRRPHDLRNTIALLEASRRQALTQHTRFSHVPD
jgi:hypothetical protein